MIQKLTLLVRGRGARSLLSLGILLSCLAAQTLKSAEKTWGGSGDWFKAENWSPAGVPSATDTINIDGGSVSFTEPVTISNQLNWTGGSINGPLTVAAGGMLNLSNASQAYLHGVLTNYGQVSITNTGGLYLYSYSGGGRIYNQPGATFELWDDVSLSQSGSETLLVNAGALRKRAGAGAAYLNCPFQNSGTVEVQSGALNFANGFTSGGTVLAQAGAAVQLTGGTFTLLAGHAFGGAGYYGVPSGGSARIEGTLTAPNFQVTGGTLSGTNLLDGTLWWQGGYMNGALTVASNSALHLANTSQVYLYGVLTNYGQVTLTNTGGLYLYSYSGGGRIYNQPGATIELWDDVSLSQSGSETLLVNAGALRKRAGAGTAYLNCPFQNSGTVEVQSGALNFANGFTSGGTVTAAANAAVQLTGGTFILLAGHTFGGAGYYGVPSGGSARIEGTLTAPNFQVTGGTLSGTNLLDGTLWWQGGYMNGALTVASNSALHLANTSQVYLYGVLTNYGQVTWTNTGGLALYSYGGGGRVYNQSGAVFELWDDVSLYQSGSEAMFINAGVLRKRAGAGTAYLYCPFQNSGTVEVQSGTLELGGKGTLGGAFLAGVSGLIRLSGEYATVAGLSFGGAGTNRMVGGSLTLAEPVANLKLTGGTVRLGANFATNTTAYLELTGANLAGTNTVAGTIDWWGGGMNGALTVAPEGQLNLLGPETKTLYGVLTNLGRVTITNSGGLALYSYGGGGRVYNQSGAVFELWDDVSLYQSGSEAMFINAGVLRKRAGAGAAYLYCPFQNSGTVEVQSGTLELGSKGTLGGTFLAGASGLIRLSGEYATVPGLSFGGAGTNRMVGGSLTLAASVPNLTLAGGTVWLGASFATNTTAYLELTGASLAGTNTVAGTIDWWNGWMNGELTVAPGGQLNLLGPDTKYLGGVLTNYGQVTMTNSGGLALYSYGGGGRIYNQPGAVFELWDDVSLYQSGSEAVLANAGALRKRAGTGTAYLYCPFQNSGSVEVESGTLELGSKGTLGGAFLAGAEGVVRLTGDYVTATGLSFGGAGTNRMAGGNLLLTEPAPNLKLAGGNVSLGPSFATNTTACIELVGANLWGTNTVAGTIDWSGGWMYGKLTMTSEGRLNLLGSGIKYLAGILTNYGLVAMTNSGGLYLYSYSGGGQMYNQPGAIFEWQDDVSLYPNGSETLLVNAGLLRKSAGAGTSDLHCPCQNTGTVEVQSGMLSFGTAPTLGDEGAISIVIGGPTAGTEYGQVRVSGTAALHGFISARFIHGYCPTNDQVFIALTADSLAGNFANTSIPGTGGIKALTPVYTSREVQLHAVVEAEGNTAPMLTAPGDQTVDEMTLLTVTNRATDADLPANTLYYALVDGPPGAQLDHATGVFTWTPTETHGPGTFSVTIKVTDDGVPSLSDIKSFMITVREVNRAPEIAPVAERTISAIAYLELYLSATDPDSPGNQLTWVLLDGPAGAALDPASGKFTWSPLLAQAASTNRITVKASDNGVPSLSATNSFTVIVRETRVTLPVMTNVVYYDPFTGGAGAALNQTRPADHEGIGAERWAAPEAGLELDGEALAVKQTPFAAFLPFVPEPGYQYKVSVDMHPTHSGSDWLAIGFAEMDLTNDWMAGQNTSGWMLLRGENPQYPLHCFLGYGLNGQGSLDWFTGPHQLAVVLDTTPVHWTFEFFIDGVSQRGPVPFSTAPGVNPAILFAGLGAYGSARGTFDNFRLESALAAEAVPPVIVQAPADVITSIGKNATFTVVATGTPPLAYQWRKDGANIAEATASSLTIPNVQPGDAGQYSVAVSNAYGGVVSANATLTVQEEYCVTVAAYEVVYPAGIPVPLRVTASGCSTAEPVSNAAALVWIKTAGITRTLPVATDETGRAVVYFTPLAGETGDYEIAGSRPDAGEPAAQDRFTLAGMSLGGSGASHRLKVGVPVTNRIELRNLTGVALSGLAATVTGAPANVNVQVETPAMLEGGATNNLAYTLTASGASPAQSRFTIQVVSAAGLTNIFTVDVTVAPPAPQLVATPVSLAGPMLRGTQRLVSFRVANVGGAASGELEVLVPAVDWLALVSPSRVPSLAPDESTEISLLLTPASALTLGVYSGSVLLWGEAAELTVPFTFNCVSALRGHLLVSVEDEFTYYGEGHPRVTNATVTVTDPLTGTNMASRVTGAAGTVLFTNLAEAYYDVMVRADQHGDFRSTVLVAADQTNEFKAFLARQMVTCTWVVVPTEIPDHYTFELQTTFETRVPWPVITIEPGAFNLCDLAGETNVVNVTVSNHGLIKAAGLRLEFAAHPRWEVKPLVADLGDLAAQTNLVVPVLFRKINGATGDGLAGIGAALNYHVSTGTESRFYQAPLYVYNANPSACSSGGSGSAPVYIPPSGNGASYEAVAGRSPSMPYVNYPAYSPAPAEGVVVRVKLKLQQDAVMSRNAFSATLELVNTAGAPLSDLEVALDLRDAEQAPAADRFGITPPQLTGLDAVDGTGGLNPGATGRAAWTIIPATNAAPDAPTAYTIGGTVTYVQDGLRVTIPLFPVPVTVLPDARLLVDYFWEQEVYSDDPFTAEIEPAIPFGLGLIVKNTGKGAARDFTITSAQPKIVENESGLAIDFQLIAAQVGGQAAAPRLTLNLGDIAPGQSASGTWWLTASLQGRFTEYAARFEHRDDLGGKNLSLVDRVSIHPMMHVVRALTPADDGAPDYLVSDNNTNGIPDRLYFSRGSNAPVAAVTNGVTTGVPSYANSNVTFTATAPAGWVYLRVADPSQGTVPLAGVRRFDGSEVLMGSNAWTTHRTVRQQGTPPYPEHWVHILDCNPSATYTLVYGVAGAISPQITSLPRALTNAPGTSLTLDVMATGTQPLFYQWLFNGAALPGATGPTLTLNPVKSAHAGTYSVVVSNVADTVTGVVAVLTVPEPPPSAPSIVEQPLDLTIAAGNPAAFSVTAGGTPPFAYQWFKDGAALSNGARLAGATSASLTISAAQTGDTGAYRVVITNVAGAITSQVARLSVSTGTPGVKRWELAAGRSVMSSPAIGEDGTLYVGCGYEWGWPSARVYALDPATGAKKWEFLTPDAVHTVPALGTDGTVYVGCVDGKVYALEGATGRKRWDFATGGLVLSAPALGADGTVYVGSGDRKLYALAGATGAKLWEFATGDMVQSAPALAPDGTVYVGSFDGKLYALDGATGAERWRFATGDGVYSSPALGPDQTVYVGSLDRKVYALNGATGAKRWEFATQDRVFSSPMLGPDGTVYIGSDDGRVYALDGATGAKRWEFATGGNISASPGIGADGAVYVGSRDRKVYALDGATGAKLWEFTTGDWVISSPTIAADGTVYIGCNDGKLYALYSGSVGGPAQSAWPIFHQNARHTGRVESTTPVVPPAITAQPQSQTNSVGTTATFSVTASGTPPLNYQWRKDGANLVDGGRVSGAGAATLLLTNVQTGDAGDYAVVVNNASGSVTSLVARLSVSTGLPGTKRWEFHDPFLLDQSSPAIGADGTVYFGGNGMVYALDGATGAQRWRRDTYVGIRSSPAITANGVVNIGLDNERVYAMDGVTGSQLWEFNCSGLSESSIFDSSPAIGADGTVYIGNQNRRLYALDGTTGAKKWEFIDPDGNAGEIYSSPAIGADGTVYFGGRSGIFYAVNGATGAKRWQFYAGAQVASSPAIGADGTIYFGSIGPSRVYALEGGTGVKKWEFAAGGYVISSPVLGADGAVYIGADDGKLYALDPVSGAKRWEFATADKIRSAPAIGADGVVYAGSFDGKLYALNGATGQKLWEFATGDAIESSPVIAADGTLYFVSDDRRIYALWTSSVGGLAGSPWPMFHQNARHTGRVGANAPTVPPTITAQPRSRTNFVGTTATFSVTATGTEPLNYRWRKDGTALSDDLRLIGAASPELTIGQVQSGDTGAYTVVVTNGAGAITSLVATLTVNTVSPGVKRWEFVAGDTVDAAVSLDDNGSLYVGSYDGKLYALDSATGAKRWEAVTGDRVSSTPALGANGLVYVAPWNGHVYAFEATTGAKRWEFVTGNIMRTSPAIGADGTVYVGSFDRKVYALAGDTGAKRWEFATVDFVSSSPAVSADGTVYVGSFDFKVYALAGATGTKRWEFATGGPVLSSPALGADGTVYVGSSDRKVYALRGDTGAKVWEFATGDVVYSSPALGPDGCVYVGSEDGKVYALEGATGAKRWEYATGGKIHLSSPAVGADGTVYVGSWDGSVYALDAVTGAKRWAFATGGSVVASPTIAPDGTVYAGSADHRLYALYSESVGGAADSPWPMFHRNPRHTGRVESTVTRLALERAPQPPLRLLLEGTVGQVYAIEVSSNLARTNWVWLTDVQPTNPVTVILDWQSTNHPVRFYRSRRHDGILP